jgi:hypothetical protein
LVRTLIEQRLEALLRDSFPTQHPRVTFDGERFAAYWKDSPEARTFPKNLLQHLHLSASEARDLVAW